jgi:hypothetical protein
VQLIAKPYVLEERDYIYYLQFSMVNIFFPFFYYQFPPT